MASNSFCSMVTSPLQILMSASVWELSLSSCNFSLSTQQLHTNNTILRVPSIHTTKKHYSIIQLDTIVTQFHRSIEAVTLAEPSLCQGNIFIVNDKHPKLKTVLKISEVVSISCNFSLFKYCKKGYLLWLLNTRFLWSNNMCGIKFPDTWYTILKWSVFYHTRGGILCGFKPTT